MTRGLGGSIDGEAMQLRYRDLVIPYNLFDFAMIEGAPNLRNSLHTGTPSTLEVGDGTLQMHAIMLDSGDIVGAQVVKPDDVDLDGLDIRCALGFQVDEASKANIDWKATIKGVADGAARILATTTPDGSIVFAAEANTSIMEVRETPFMPFDLVSSAGVNAIAADLLWDLTVELDDKGTATANKIGLLYAKLRMTRKLTADGAVRETT